MVFKINVKSELNVNTKNGVIECSTILYEGNYNRF